MEFAQSPLTTDESYDPSLLSDCRDDYEGDTLMSDNITDCISDSCDLDEENQRWLAGINEDEILNDDCASLIGLESPEVATCDTMPSSEASSVKDGYSGKEGTPIAKRQSGVPRPTKKFSPFRHNTSYGSSSSSLGSKIPQPQRSKSFYTASTSSNSSGETSEESAAPKKVRTNSITNMTAGSFIMDV